MSAKHVYEGESQDGKLQEALEKAIEKLNADLPEGGVCDPSASWVITEISGMYGGIAHLTSIKVKITAKRNPDWTPR